MIAYKDENTHAIIITITFLMNLSVFSFFLPLGYFSLINDRGTSTATLYTTIVQLVRERVYKFLSVDSLTAYTETQNSDTFPVKTSYVKGTARAGQIFKLLAVFQDGNMQDCSNTASSVKDSTNSIGREKERGRYAQLLGENRQVNDLYYPCFA